MPKHTTIEKIKNLKKQMANDLLTEKEFRERLKILKQMKMNKSRVIGPI